MIQFNKGDRVEYTGIKWHHLTGKFGTVVVDDRTRADNVRVDFYDGRVYGCCPESLRRIKVVPGVITIDRADLPEVVEEGDGEFSCNGIDAYRSISAPFCRQRATVFLALAETLEAAAKKESDAVKKLNERRDALANKFIDGVIGYDFSIPAIKRAVDAYIALEDAHDD